MPELRNEYTIRKIDSAIAKMNGFTIRKNENEITKL